MGNEYGNIKLSDERFIKPKNFTLYTGSECMETQPTYKRDDMDFV